MTAPRNPDTLIHAFLEAGLTRMKNVGHIAAKTRLACAVKASRCAALGLKR